MAASATEARDAATSVAEASLAAPAETPSTSAELLAGTRRLLGVRNHAELEQRCSEIGTGDQLIEGLLPSRSIAIVVGDSGLGKSPLIYQAGICIAAGVPFLGLPVRQGTVLYMDYENGLEDSAELIARICTRLGLTPHVPNFFVWHYGDCHPQFGTDGYKLEDMIKLIRPDLTILDSLSAYHPEIEDKNSIATGVFKDFRTLIRKYNTSVLGIHHIKKPSPKSSEAPASLEDCDPKHWLQQARGPRALINGSDIRLGVDVPGASSSMPGLNGTTSDQVALVFRGFGRIRGEIGPFFVARSFDDDGEPIGYRRMTGVELLFNQTQQEAFMRLPATFAFREAKRIYDRADQATTEFLKKCIGRGLLRKVARGQYGKCGAPE